MKTCNKCNQEKPETEEFFHKRKDNGKFRNECIECKKLVDKQRDPKKRSEQMKRYYQENRDVILEKNRKYEQEHPRNRNEYRREYYHKQKIKEKIEINEKFCYQCNEVHLIDEFNKSPDSNDGHKSYCKEHQHKVWNVYFKENKETILRKGKEWNIKHKDYMREYQREWQQNERDDNPIYRLRQNVGRVIRNMLNGSKNSSIAVLLPYSIEELKEHLQKQFTSEMTWDNYGSYWELDHVYPQSLLPYETTEHENFKKCWALSNLQPLTISENRSKNNRV